MLSQAAASLVEEPFSEPPPAYFENLDKKARDLSITTSRGLHIHQPSVAEYMVPGSNTNHEQTITILTTDVISPNTSQSLVDVLLKQASLPPKAVLRIKGTHDWGVTTVDFDIRINMTQLFSTVTHSKIFPRAAQPVSMDSKPTDEELMLQCIEDSDYQGENYTALSIERHVTNWDTAFLQDRLLLLIADTKYDGTVEISFPEMYSHFILQNKSPPTEDYLVSPTTWWKRFFGVKTDGITERDWAKCVVRSYWPYASTPAGSMDRKCAVQSESAWLEEWQGGIRNAILNEHRGWLTEDDLMDLRAGVNKASEKWYTWGYSG